MAIETTLDKSAGGAGALPQQTTVPSDRNAIPPDATATIFVKPAGRLVIADELPQAVTVPLLRSATHVLLDVAIATMLVASSVIFVAGVGPTKEVRPHAATFPTVRTPFVLVTLPELF